MESLQNNLNWDYEKLFEFWNFVHERHQIYTRRFEENLPPPWTHDPVLRNVFFTNVYRELDRGTIYLAENVINQKGGDPVSENFEILLYRQFNNRKTYESLKQAGRKYGDWKDWKGISELLKSWKAEGQTIFCEAHMITGVKWGGFKEKADNLSWLMNVHWRNREKIYDDLISAHTLQDLWYRITCLNGFGPFLAYEVATDHGYSKALKRFDEDDWVNPGPGCKRGIDILLPDIASQDVSYEEVISFLRKSQRQFFDNCGLDFLFYKGRELTLRNVEHSLCEYSKYFRAKYRGRAKRKYPGG